MQKSERISVLVVSDDDRVVEGAKALSAERYSLTHLAGSIEALKWVAKNPCDIAVVELDPGGFGLAKDLRAMPSVRYIRLVMLCDRPHDRWLCKQAGADEVIVKPLADSATLLAAIDSVLPAAS